MSIARTAFWAAAARAEESSRADRIFDDPYADTLAGEEGRRLLAILNDIDNGRSPLITIRTKVFDIGLTAMTNQGGVRQVVNLAAGLDCRMLRLSWPNDFTYYEIDQTEVLEYKTAQLARMVARPTCCWKPIAANLAADWETSLLAAGFDVKRPTAWLCEGLLYYLGESQVSSLLAKAAHMSSSGSSLFFDVITKQVLTSSIPSIHDLINKMKSIGCPFVWGVDDLNAFAARSGWVVEKWLVTGEEEANFDRWPTRIPVMPRELTSCPRTLLVHAKKA